MAYTYFIFRFIINVIGVILVFFDPINSYYILGFVVVCQIIYYYGMRFMGITQFTNVFKYISNVMLSLNYFFMLYINRDYFLVMFIITGILFLYFSNKNIKAI